MTESAADLALKYKLTPTQAFIFEEMMAKGWVSTEWINDLLDRGRTEQVHPKAAAVHISHLRRKLGPHGYDVVCQRGFRRYRLVRDQLEEMVG